jgi:hypothetical protein
MDDCTYSLTVFQRLDPHAGSLLATTLRVEVAKPLDWVRQHADEIAHRAVNVARFGQPVALWVANSGGCHG